MGIFSIILGVLLVVGGFSCMFTPLATFLSTGYFMGIMLLAFGIAGIIRCVNKKAGALDWCINILSVIVGIIALFRPGSTLLFDGIMLIIIACWFLVVGVYQITVSISSRATRKGWYWTLIAGILGVLLGIYSFMHPMVTAVAAGILIGFYFVEAGISLIALGVATSD